LRLERQIFEEKSKCDELKQRLAVVIWDCQKTSWSGHPCPAEMGAISRSFGIRQQTFWVTKHWVC